MITRFKIFENLELKKYLVFRSFDPISDIFTIFTIYRIIGYDELTKGFDKKYQRVNLEEVYIQFRERYRVKYS